MNFTKSTVFLGAGHPCRPTSPRGGHRHGHVHDPGDPARPRHPCTGPPVRVHSAFVEGLVLAAAVLFLWNGLS